MNEVRKIQHRPSWEPTLLLRVFLDGRQRHTKEFLWSILSSFKTVLLLSQKPWKEEGKLQIDFISNTCVLLTLHCKIQYLIDLHIYDQVQVFCFLNAWATFLKIISEKAPLSKQKSQLFFAHTFVSLI